MTRFPAVFLLFLFCKPVAHAQEMVSSRKNRKFCREMHHTLKTYGNVFNHPEDFRYEALYGKIITDKSGNKKVIYYHDGNRDIYFYPASIVKLPVAIKFMEWINESTTGDLSPVKILPVADSACGYPIGNNFRHYYIKTTRKTTGTEILKTCYTYTDRTVKDSLLSLPDSIPAYTVIRLTSATREINAEQVLSEMLIFSDNANYNLVFEATAPLVSGINQLVDIPRPFLPCAGDYLSQGAALTLFDQQWKNNTSGNTGLPVRHHMKNETVGTAQMRQGNDTVKTGRDFSAHNHVPLMAALTLLQELVYPASVREKHFRLSAAGRIRLLEWLGNNPASVCAATRADYLHTPSNYTNYLFPYADSVVPPAQIRFYNIVGQAYGFSTDVLYYCDTVAKTEFFAAMRIYTNRNEILNDDTYEYDTIMYPLMRDFFNYLLLEEKKRKITPTRSLNFPSHHE